MSQKKIGLDLYFRLYFNFLTRIDVQMIFITYSRVNEDFSVPKHLLCDFFSFKLSNILIIGSKVIWQNFLRKLVFLNFIFFTFLPLILLTGKISEHAAPLFLRINVSKLLINFCIDNSKNISVVAPRSSSIFFLTYFILMRVLIS